MSTGIRQETLIFLNAVVHGALMTFSYDILRAVRRAFVHNLTAVSIEDFLYWMCTGFLTFCFAFQKTEGVIRGYVAVGMAMGAAIYYFSLSCLVVKVFFEVFHAIKKLFEPFGKLCFWGKKGIEFAGKWGYNLFVRNKKRFEGDLQEDDRYRSENKRGRTYGKKKKTSKQK